MACLFIRSAWLCSVLFCSLFAEPPFGCYSSSQFGGRTGCFGALQQLFWGCCLRARLCRVVLGFKCADEVAIGSALHSPSCLAQKRSTEMSCCWLRVYFRGLFSSDWAESMRKGGRARPLAEQPQISMFGTNLGAKTIEGGPPSQARCAVTGIALARAR